MLLSRSDIAIRYGVSKQLVDLIVNKYKLTPATIGKQGVMKYHPNVLKHFDEYFARQRKKSPDGCSGILNLRVVLGISRHIFFKARQHKDFPKPKGVYIDRCNRDQPYWNIEEVKSFFAKYTNEPKVTVKDRESVEDDKWPIPEYAPIPQLMQKLIRWDFRSNL